jgi:hypothetical protein
LREYAIACQEKYGEQKRGAGDRLLNLLPQRLKLALANRIIKSAALRRKYIFEYAFGFAPARLHEIQRNSPATISRV